MIDFKYRPEVDGLRAVAVLVVLLFHAGLGFSGGFVGVDVFFVISGFLITGLIYKALKNDSFEFNQFWVRRIRRIIPAVTAMVTVTLALSAVFLMPSEFETLANSAIAQQFMVSNIYFWQTTGYFDGPGDLKPLLHTWSLAVEEQFYIGYPFLLYFIRKFKVRNIALTLLLLSLVSSILSVLGTRYYPEATFYVLPTRAWEMLIGGLIVFAPTPTKMKNWQLESVSFIGLACILASAIFYDSSTTFPGLAALLPCGGAVLFIYVNSNKLTYCGKALALKPVVFVGLISYSLYLWHWPVLVYLRHYHGLELSATISITALLFSFVLAYLSWKFIETPFRLPSNEKRSLIRTLVPAAVSGFVVVFACGTILQYEGFESRISPEYYVALQDLSWKPDKDFIKSTPVDEASGLKVLGSSEGVIVAPSVLVWGDSHLRMNVPSIHQSAKSSNIQTLLLLTDGIAPIPGTRYPNNPARTSSLVTKGHQQAILTANLSTITDVILVARWSVRTEGLNQSEMDAGQKKDRYKPLIADNLSKSYDSHDARQVDEARQVLKRKGIELVKALKAAEKRVWIIRQVPELRQNLSRDLIRHLRFGSPLYLKPVDMEAHLQRQQAANTAIDKMVQAGAIAVDPSEYIFDETGHVILVQDGRAIYRDDDHLTTYGSKTLLSPMFDKIFQSIRESQQQANSSP